MEIDGYFVLDVVWKFGSWIIRSILSKLFGCDARSLEIKA